MPELFAPGHLIPLLIVAAILFFGWKQLPDMARSVGKSLRIFKTEMKGMSDDDKVRDANKATEPKAIEHKAEPEPASDAVGPETSKPSAE